MFLPAVKVCGKPMAPVEFPPMLTPYLLAALVFAAVWIRPWQLYPIGLTIRLVFGISATMLCLWAVEGLAPQPITVVPLIILVLALVVVVVPARSHELMVARVAVIAGGASALWFAMLATDEDMLYGIHVSLVASIGMTLGSAWWWLEAHADSR